MDRLIPSSSYGAAGYSRAESSRAFADSETAFPRSIPRGPSKPRVWAFHSKRRETARWLLADPRRCQTPPDEDLGATTLRTSVPPNSANGSWWAQNETGNGHASSARRAPRACYGCHSCPSPDAKEPAREILRLSDPGTSGMPDGDAVDNTLPRLCLAPIPERPTAWWSRCVCSRESSSRNVPSSSAGRVACDPRPELDSFHRRLTRWPSPADADTDPPRRLLSG